MKKQNQTNINSAASQTRKKKKKEGKKLAKGDNNNSEVVYENQQFNTSAEVLYQGKLRRQIS